MNAERLGRLARRLRVRQRLTQVALSIRAGVSRQAVSLLERGHARQLQIGTVEAIIGALGGRLDVRMFWKGPELDRLLDAGHAALGAAATQRLESPRAQGQMPSGWALAGRARPRDEQLSVNLATNG